MLRVVVVVVCICCMIEFQNLNLVAQSPERKKIIVMAKLDTDTGCWRRLD
jgi:hypothetical protein